jgi:hypothetical protein
MAGSSLMPHRAICARPSLLETALRGLAHRVRAWLLLLLGALALAASASQTGPMLDDVTVVSRNGHAEIHIMLATPVLYRTHFPPKEGQMLNIYFSLAALGVPRSRDMQPEYRRGPPSDLVPRFYVLYVDPDIDSNAHIIVQFYQPVRFSVRPGPDARSFIITVDRKSDEKKAVP